MPESTTASFSDKLVDSLKAPFVAEADAPNANPLFTAVSYALLGVLIGRAL